MTPEEVGKAASLLGTGPWIRDQLILSLLKQQSWTERQRALVERLYREEQQRRSAELSARARRGEGGR